MADELGGAHRLQTAQQYASTSVAALQQRLAQLDAFSADYTKLQSRLQTLAGKTRHEVMVPLGPLAFQPGYLTHTNEITVLLGDNMLVERSTAQSVEIIQRRLAYLDAQRSGVQAQLDNTKDVSKKSRHMFGASNASSSSAAGADDEDEELDSSLLGVQLKDGRMVNEQGEEIVEIKEDFVDDDDEKQAEHEQKQQSTPATSSSASAAPAPPASASAASASTASSAAPVPTASGSARAFPSIMDKNFDQFWEELAELEEKEEQQETAQQTPASAAKASAQASKPPAASAAPAASAPRMPTATAAAATASSPAAPAVDPSLLEPVADPPLRPISHPADIFRAMQDARIRSGEEAPPKPVVRSTVPAAAAPASKTAVSSAVVSAPVATSRSLDAAFAEYKSARSAARAAKKEARVRERARLAAESGGKKGVRFADEQSDDDDSDSDEEHEVVRHTTPAAAKAANARAQALASKAAAQQQQLQTRPASAASARSAPAAAAPRPAAAASSSSSIDLSSAFSGEISERTMGPPPAQATVAPRPSAGYGGFGAAAPMPRVAASVVGPARGNASTAAEQQPQQAAAQPKMSKFKRAQLGLEPDG